MQTPYPKSALQGLIAAVIILGVAVTAGTVLVLAIGLTQFGILVAWLPVVLLAVFLTITLVLLQRDANARSRIDHEPH